MQVPYPTSCLVPSRKPFCNFRHTLSYTCQLIIESFIYYQPESLPLPSTDATHWRSGNSAKSSVLD
jgi:hypothetical protein